MVQVEKNFSKFFFLALFWIDLCDFPPSDLMFHSNRSSCLMKYDCGNRRIRQRGKEQSLSKSIKSNLDH